MAFCTNCGSRIEDNARFCTNCGAPLETAEAPAPETMFDQANAVNSARETYQQQGFDPQPAAQPQPEPTSYQQPSFPPNAETQAASGDTGSIGWGILGAFFPLVGLILFLVWRNTKPQTAKVAGIGAIVGFCIGMAFQFMS